MSCNISVPIEDIAESVAQMLRQQFIEKDGGTGTGNTLTDTVLRGGLTFDATAKQAICDAIERCVASQIAESQAEQDADIEDKINAGDDRLEDKINGFEDRIDAGRIVGVTREDDTVTVKLANGNEFPFSITDSSSGGDRPVQFAPSSNGDNIEITLADGSVLDMTRQEFADWLAGDESPLTTDEELEALANDIANNTGDLQSQIDALNDKFKSINYDQATLSIVDDKLRVTNEDGTFSEKPLAELLKLSPDDGNLLEVRDNGIYYGIEAPPDLANIFVDGELGDDSATGSKSDPLKTIKEAIRRTPSDKKNTIWLKAFDSNNIQQTYVMPNYTSSVGEAVRSFRSYGELYFNNEILGCLRANNSYSVYYYVAKKHSRARIIREWSKISVGGKQYQTSAPVTMVRGGTFDFKGVELVLNPPTFDVNDLPIYTNSLFNGDGTVELAGVILDATNEEYTEKLSMYIGANGDKFALITTDSMIDGDNYKTVINARNKNITMLFSQFNLVDSTAVTECDLQPEDVAIIEDNFIEKLQAPSGIIGVTRGNSGDPLNVSANFLV